MSLSTVDPASVQPPTFPTIKPRHLSHLSYRTTLLEHYPRLGDVAAKSILAFQGTLHDLSLLANINKHVADLTPNEIRQSLMSYLPAMGLLLKNDPPSLFTFVDSYSIFLRKHLKAKARYGEYAAIEQLIGKLRSRQLECYRENSFGPWCRSDSVLKQMWNKFASTSVSFLLLIDHVGKIPSPRVRLMMF